MLLVDSICNLDPFEMGELSDIMSWKACVAGVGDFNRAEVIGINPKKMA